MNLKHFNINLSSELLQSDENAYNKIFFDTLSAIKDELAKVEASLKPYQELSPREYAQAEDHYGTLIDNLNQEDMDIRIEHQKLIRS
jgi:hypothetical protein